MSYGSGDPTDYTQYSKGVSTASTWTKAKSNNGVWLFGDSITNQDDYALAVALAPRVLAVNAWNARPTKPAVDALEQALQIYNGPAKTVLMATGTNDISDPPAFGAQVDRTMELIAGRARVVWVTAYAGRTGTGITAAVREADVRNSGWINNQLWARAGKHSNLDIVDWFGFLCKNPGYRIGNLLTDGVHTSVPLGQNARNALILAAL